MGYLRFTVLLAMTFLPWAAVAMIVHVAAVH